MKKNTSNSFIYQNRTKQKIMLLLIILFCFLSLFLLINPFLGQGNVSNNLKDFASASVGINNANIKSKSPVLDQDIPKSKVEGTKILTFKEGTSQEEKESYINSLGSKLIKRIDQLDSIVIGFERENELKDVEILAFENPDYYVGVLQENSEAANKHINITEDEGTFIPDDPYYDEQWALEEIGAPELWHKIRTSKTENEKIIVAVIDSGVCLDHPDLQGRILQGYDFIENDKEPQDEFFSVEKQGHGCGVAGIIAANMDNGLGIAGTAPNSMILPVRVLDENGVGTYSSLTQGILWAADNGAKVINLSLGGYNDSSILKAAIDYASEKGIIIVAAAGNTGNESVMYPAKYDNVIAVGSVDAAGTNGLNGISSFSSRGYEIEVYAYGNEIISLSPNNSAPYSSYTGTSFAAPLVTGLGLLASHKNGIKFENFLELNNKIIANENLAKIGTESTKTQAESILFEPAFLSSGDIQEFFVSQGSPLANYKSSLDGSEMTAAEIILMSSSKSDWSLNPEIVLSFLELKWNLMQPGELTSEKIDELVHFTDEVKRDFLSQAVWLGDKIWNLYQYENAGELASYYTLQNALSSYDLEYEAFMEVHDDIFSRYQKVYSQTDWSPIFREPYGGNPAINSFFDHGAYGDGYTTRTDARSTAGTVTSCTLGFSCYDRHNGVDYATGTNSLYAAGSGTIYASGTSHDNCGSYYADALRVIITHSNGFRTKYWHLSSIANNPRTGAKWASGDTINEGEKIGNSGTTGCSSGNHLHFGLEEISSGARIDPYGYFGSGRQQPLYKSSMTVSEQGNGFEKFYKEWWWDSTSGDGGHSYYTLSQQNSTAYENWAIWWADISTSGEYEVMAYVPSAPEASGVRYKIMHRDGIATVSRDQTSYGGQWMSLGTYYFNANGHAAVLLTDYASGPDSKKIFFDAIKWVEGNTPPSITINQPDGSGDITDTAYTITWTDSDPDNDATISLYYDTNNSGNDGTLIIGGISENDGANAYVWDTTSIPDGDYWIYAIIDDGENSVVYDYSSGPITIDHYDDPPSIQIVQPDGVNDIANLSYTITWSDSDPDDNAQVSLYYDSNDTGLNGTLITNSIFEDDTPDEYTWDTSIIPAGDYYIYGTINDGTNPQAADYSSGAVTIVHSEIPVIQVTDPNGTDDTTNTSYTIRWTDSDTDSSASISLYYDSNNSGLNGTLIVSGLNEDDPDASGQGEIDSYTWDTSALSEGSYYIYAVINDGINPDVTDYSSGKITIKRSYGTSLWLPDFGYSHGWTTASHVRTIADVNNDGKDDIVGFKNDGVWVSLSNGDGFNPKTRWLANYFGDAYGWDNVKYVRTMADVDGDGDADVVGFGDDDVWVSKSNGSNAFSAPSSWTSYFDYAGKRSDGTSYGAGWRVEKHVRTLGDIDGDGDDDIVGFGDDDVWVGISNGSTAFAGPSSWHSCFDYNGCGWRVDQHVRLIANITGGDSRDDIVGFGNDDVIIARSSGSAFGSVEYWYSGYTINNGGWQVGLHPRVVADITGDGKGDIIGFGNSGISVSQSNGNGFNSGNLWLNDYGYNQGWLEREPRMSGDVDGDNISDIVGFADEGVYVTLSTGSGPKLNDAPEITSAPITQVNPVQVYQYDVNANDPNSDTLTYGLIEFPAGMTINSSTGLISWAATAGDLGTHFVKVSVSDGSLIDTQAFILQVINEPPTIQLTQPDGIDDLSYGTFIITWVDDDSDSDAAISLFYDTDNTGEDGTLIISGISEDDPSNSYVWDTSALNAGNYYIYAIIDDGVNPPVPSYSFYPVQIIVDVVCPTSLCNGDFEAAINLEYWKAGNGINQIVTDIVQDGAKAYYSEHTYDTGANPRWSGASQNVTVESAQTYGLTGFYRSENAARGHFKITWKDSSDTVLQVDYPVTNINGTNTNWIEFSKLVIAPSGASSAEIKIWHGVNGSSENVMGSKLWIDSLSFDVATTSCGTLCNESFEHGVLYWIQSGAVGSNTIETTGAHEGIKALKSEQLYSSLDETKWTGMTQYAQVKETTTYRFRFWLKKTNLNNGHVRIRWRNSSGSLLGTEYPLTGINGTTSTWYKREANVTAPVSAVKAEISIWHGVNGGVNVQGSTMWIDDITMICQSLCNPGFEDGTIHWEANGKNEVEIITTDVQEGLQAIKVVQNLNSSDIAQWAGISQRFTISGGVSYDLKFWLKKLDTAQGHLKVKWRDSSDQVITTIYPKTGMNGTDTAWVMSSMTLAAPVNAETAEIFIWHGIDSGNQNATGSTLYIDNITFAQVL